MPTDTEEPLEDLFGAILACLGAWHAFMRVDHSEDDDEISDDAVLFHHTVGELRAACDAVLTMGLEE